MKIFDKHRRVLVEISRQRLQIGGFVIEPTEGVVNGVIVGFDPNRIVLQTKKEQCTKCNRRVPHACEVSYDPERCMMLDGPWDFACDEFYHPWKYGYEPKVKQSLWVRITDYLWGRYKNPPRLHNGYVDQSTSAKDIV